MTSQMFVRYQPDTLVHGMTKKPQMKAPEHHEGEGWRPREGCARSRTLEMLSEPPNGLVQPITVSTASSERPEALFLACPRRFTVS
jgi:hypothetical protein